jgi:hypothetical protein
VRDAEVKDQDSPVPTNVIFIAAGHAAGISNPFVQRPQTRSSGEVVARWTIPALFANRQTLALEIRCFLAT